MTKKSRKNDVFWIEEPPDEKEKKICLELKNPCFWVNCRNHLRPEDHVWKNKTVTEKLEILFSMEETCCKRLCADNRWFQEEEIGQLLGLTVGSVKWTFVRALRKVRFRMKEQVSALA